METIGEVKFEFKRHSCVHLDKNSRNSYILNVDEVFLGFSFKNLSHKSMCKLFSKEKIK